MGRYSWFVRAGLGVILTAFLLSVVVLIPRNAASVASAADVVADLETAIETASGD